MEKLMGSERSWKPGDRSCDKIEEVWTPNNPWRWRRLAREQQEFKVQSLSCPELISQIELFFNDRVRLLKMYEFDPRDKITDEFENNPWGE